MTDVQFKVPIDVAKRLFPEFEFFSALGPSSHKSAFHVRRDGRDLCLKIISPQYPLDRAQREVLAMEAIRHPNVVRLVEYQLVNRDGTSRHYMLEEFVAGNDLADLLLSGRGWPLDKIVTVFGQICDGLGELKAQQIVHRDLKPSNIRVRKDGTPVLVDFGLARLLDKASLTELHQGARIGTPTYFSPEQFTGTKRDIDHRTDLFALGIMLHQAAVGEHPFVSAQDQTFDELCDSICDSDDFCNKPGFQALTPRLQLIIRRLLQKERVRRPDSATTVGALLRKIGAQ